MKKKIFLTFLVLILFASWIIPSPIFAGKTNKTFAIVYPIVHPFFEPVTERAVKYGKEKGVKVITKAPEGTDVNQQIEIMENLISMKVDGIALCATDPDALTPIANKAIDKGIPVIAFESDLPQSKRYCFMGTDNYKAGVHLAHVLGRELKPKGSVIICTGLPTQRSLNERIRGIKETLLKEYPYVTIADLQTGQGDPSLTLNVIEAQIQANPDFSAFTSIDATGGPVAVSIWRSKNWKDDKHKIITFDDMPENLQGIREGMVTAVVSQRQWTWGTKIVDRLLDVIEGRAVQNYDDTGTVEITADNVDNYYDAEPWKLMK